MASFLAGLQVIEDEELRGVAAIQASTQQARVGQRQCTCGFCLVPGMCSCMDSSLIEPEMLLHVRGNIP